eukprot:2369447-Prymnesium_polylepis.1
MASSSHKPTGPSEFITSGLIAFVFIFDCVAARYDLPAVVRQQSGRAGSKVKSAAAAVLKAFKAMASASETALLRDAETPTGVVKET